LQVESHDISKLKEIIKVNEEEIASHKVPEERKYERREKEEERRDRMNSSDLLLCRKK
jgi:hypothetical protein